MQEWELDRRAIRGDSSAVSPHSSHSGATSQLDVLAFFYISVAPYPSLASLSNMQVLALRRCRNMRQQNTNQSEAHSHQRGSSAAEAVRGHPPRPHRQSRLQHSWTPEEEEQGPSANPSSLSHVQGYRRRVIYHSQPYL